MSTPHRSRRIAAVRRLLAGTAAVLVGTILATVPVAAQEDDPTLDQHLDADQGIATEAAVLSTGHVDIGPRFVDDEWTLMVHDDTTSPSAWRDLSRTVLQVGDAALATIPDDPTYGFLGLAAGAEVHVVPQTQDPEVVWVGWNTQDPEVMERIDRGATLTLLGVEGPGTVTMYLQSGNFGAPEVLWDSTVADPQPLWVDVNTHTHANWVFSEPGIHLVTVQASADLIDGTSVDDVQVLRFAVGDSTSTDEALAAEVPDRVDAPGDDASAPGTSADRTDVVDATATDGSGSVLLVVAMVGAAVLLAAAVVVVVLRGARAKARAEQELGADRDGGPA